MTELRRRMIRAMTVRGLSPRTHESYLTAVHRLAAHYRRPPDQLSVEEVQAHLEHLVTVRKLSHSTCSIAANAFRFFFHVTLGRDRVDFEVPRQKTPQRLPEILSREEVSRLLDAPPLRRHRFLLGTAYAGGLWVSEVVSLRFTDVDRDRKTLRVEQGKGRKDRYLPLSTRWLVELDAHAKTLPTRSIWI